MRRRLAMLCDQVFVLDHMYVSVFATCGWLLRLGVTVALLMTIHPALSVLAVAALPTVLTSTWWPAVERSAMEAGAQANRLARHLFTVATTAPPGEEVRVTGIGARLATERRVAWERGYRPIAAARSVSAVWHTLAWTIFGLSYVGAAVAEIGFSGGFWMDGSRRLAWLEDHAAAVAANADAPVPTTIRSGIRLANVSFAYFQARRGLCSTTSP